MKRLIAVSAWVVGISLFFGNGFGAVISFETASDLTNNFTPTGNNTSSWAVQSGGGLNVPGGGPGNSLSAPDAGGPSWLVYNTSSPGDAVSSLGIYFNYVPLVEPVNTSYIMTLGIGPSNSFVPVFSNSGDPAQNFFAVYLLRSNQDAQGQYQYAFGVNNVVNGAFSNVSTNYSSPGLLLSSNWYYISMDTTFNASTSTYSIVGSLFASDANGTLSASPLLTITVGNISQPVLQGDLAANAFLGTLGQAERRGIAAMDNFSMNAVPEPASLILFGLGSSILVIWQRRNTCAFWVKVNEEA